MKSKTSITLSADLLKAIDELSGPGVSRSAFIERALRTFLTDRRWSTRDARDLGGINRHATSLNAEATDVLGYQVRWAEE